MGNLKKKCYENQEMVINLAIKLSLSVAKKKEIEKLVKDYE